MTNLYWKNWWRNIIIATLTLQIFMLATGAPGICFPLAGGGTLLIGAVLPPWIGFLRLTFLGQGASPLMRLLYFLFPVSIGFTALKIGIGAVGFALFLAVTRVISLFS